MRVADRANLVEDIVAGQWRDPIGGAITGERRGDWENLIFGGPSSVEGAVPIGGVIPIDPGTAGPTHGVVGAITRRLGFFRNGYQTMLALVGMAAGRADAVCGVRLGRFLRRRRSDRYAWPLRRYSAAVLGVRAHLRPPKS